jgi:hypothetical protein
MNSSILTAIFLLTFSSLALAHGTDKNIMGTATEVAADHLIVRATDGHEVRVSVNPETKFLKDHSPAAAADLRNGSRVVVELSGSGEKAVAAEVHFSSAAAHGSATGAPAGGASQAPGQPKH